MSNDVRAQAETIAAKVKFLDAYRSLGNISAASRVSGVGRRTHYDWLESDEEYAKDFADATEQAHDVLEMEARRRAVNGVKEDVFYKGRVVGTLKKYSDVLLIFLLKGARPDKYKDRHQHEHTGKNGGAIAMQHSAVDLLKHATDAELDVLEGLHRRALAAAAEKTAIDTTSTTAPATLSPHTCPQCGHEAHEAAEVKSPVSDNVELVYTCARCRFNWLPGKPNPESAKWNQE